MLGFLKWFVRILMICGILAIAFAAGFSTYLHDWLLAAAMAACFVVTLYNVQLYFKRERHVIGSPGSILSGTARLAVFWAVIVFSLVAVVWVIRNG